jgi:hypothetical protein
VSGADFLEADFGTIFGAADSPIPQLLRITYGMGILRQLTSNGAANRGILSANSGTVIHYLNSAGSQEFPPCIASDMVLR